MDTSKLLWGLALLTIIAFSCCEKDTPPPSPTEAPYRWKLETRMFTSIYPVYADESYLIFPTNYQTGQMYLLRVDERTGDTIYNVELLGIDDNLSTLNAEAYADDDELHVVMDRNFYKVDIATGQVKTRYDFPNFLWQGVNIQGDYVYTCSYGGQLDSFYYSYFHKDIGVQHRIYGAKISDGLNLMGGHPPVLVDDRFLLPFFEGVQSSNDFDNYIIDVSPDTVRKVGIDFESGTIGGPVFDDEENIYLYMIDKLVAYRKSDLTARWELETVPAGSGPYFQTEDKIYMVPSREINDGEGNAIFIIDKATGNHKELSGPACLGRLVRIGDYIYFVGWGDFWKFDMINERFIPEREDEDSQAAFAGGYQPFFGISPNSKILFNENGWNCFPL